MTAGTAGIGSAHEHRRFIPEARGKGFPHCPLYRDQRTEALVSGLSVALTAYSRIGTGRSNCCWVCSYLDNAVTEHRTSALWPLVQRRFR